MKTKFSGRRAKNMSAIFMLIGLAIPYSVNAQVNQSGTWSVGEKQSYPIFNNKSLRDVDVMATICVESGLGIDVKLIEKTNVLKDTLATIAKDECHTSVVNVPRGDEIWVSSSVGTALGKFTFTSPVDQEKH
jgi:hypothetical protein